MTTHPLLLLALLSLLALSTAQTAFQTAPDPRCTRGLLERGACCPPQCGVCGGLECGPKGAQLKSNCCPNSILAGSRRCSDVGPPCRLASSASRQSNNRANNTPPRDPTCARGLKNGPACCPKKCRKCGGAGCGRRSKAAKTLCCRDGVQKRTRSCSVRGPPCKITVRTGGGGGGGGNGGGSGGGNKLNGSWKFAPINSGRLTQRHEACAVMIRGRVVLVGGRGQNKPVSIYNPKTAAWVNKAGPGGGFEIHHMQCVAVGSKVYIPSSWTGGFPFEKNNDKIYIYDVDSDKWSTRAGLPEGRRRGGAAAVLRNGIIYVVGGNRGGHGGHAQTLGWMDSYNIAQDKWTTNLPTMPDGRDHTGGAMVKGQLCVAGGRDGGIDGFFNANKKSTWCYNFGTKKWAKKADFPGPRAGANTGAICGGGMMIAGGEGGGDASRRVDVFDGSSWKQGPSLVQKRHGSGLAVAKCTCGQIFIPSGSGSQGGSPELFSTERFLPAGKPANCANY